MEPLKHPIWTKRVRCLASLLPAPATLARLQREAHAAWGWSHDLTTQVVCAGEGNELRARLVKGEWHYGRVPGVYAVPPVEYAKQLRKSVDVTVRPRKRKLVRT